MEEEVFQNRFHYVTFNFFGTLSNAAFKFVALAIIIRFLSVSNFGVYNILISILTVASLIGSLGIEPIMERYMPENYEKKNYYVMNKLLKNGLLIKLVAGVLLVGAMIFFSSGISSLLNFSMQEFLLILGVLVIVMLEVKLLDSAILSLLDHTYRSVFNFLSGMAYFIFTYFFLVWGYGINGVLLSFLIMNLILLFAFLIRSYLLVMRKRQTGEKVPIFKRMARYGIPMYFTGLGDIIFNVSLDNFLISFFIGTFFVGMYSFAYMIPQYLFVYSPAMIAAPIVLPIAIRKYVKTGSKEQLNSSFNFFNKATAFFSIPLTIGIIILSEQFITYIFGIEYLGSMDVFVFYMIIFAVWSFARPISIVIRVLERADIVIKARVFIIWNLVMDIILIPIIGIMGAAIATGTSVIFLISFQFYMIRKEIKLQYPWKAFLRLFVNTIPAAAMLLIARDFVSDIFSLVALIMMGTVIYLATCKLNRTFKEDKTIIEQETKLNIFRHF